MATIACSCSEQIVDSGVSRTICVDRDTIVYFEEYKGNIYKCQTSEGRTLIAKGKAIARINLVFPNNRIIDLNVRCEYVPEGLFNLLLTTKIYYEHGIGQKDQKNTFVNLNNKSIIIVYAYRKQGVLFLYIILIRLSQSTKVKAPLNVSYVFSLIIIIPKLVYFRLGHVSQPIAKINYYRISDEVYGNELFNYKLYKRAKSRRIVSYIP